MDNATQALMIAARVILASVILVLIVFFFRNMRVLPTSEDDANFIEQTRLFNLEYEVYEKKIMYGVDVISCLNKAKSHNEKYVEGGFLAGVKHGSRQEFFIQVEFTLADPLVESIAVYYIKENVTGDLSKEQQYRDEEYPGGRAFITIGNPKGAFIWPSTGYQDKVSQSDRGSIMLKSKEDIETQIEAGTYKLLTETGAGLSTGVYEDKLTSEVVALLSASGEMRQYVRNTDKESNIGYGEGKWSSAEWKTALYDFKQRKFECTEIHYSEQTGRIDRIAFNELNAARLKSGK